MDLLTNDDVCRHIFQKLCPLVKGNEEMMEKEPKLSKDMDLKHNTFVTVEIKVT